MSRLDGGPSSDSSSSRSCFRSRSRRGACRLEPAPDGVPVERRVRIGLVGPATERPAAGVWASVSSRPPRPARDEGFRAWRGALRAVAFREALVARPVARERFEVWRAVEVFFLAVFLAVFFLAVRAAPLGAPLCFRLDAFFAAALRAGVLRLFLALVRAFERDLRVRVRAVAPARLDVFAFAEPRFRVRVLPLAVARFVFAMCASGG